MGMLMERTVKRKRWEWCLEGPKAANFCVHARVCVLCLLFFHDASMGALNSHGSDRKSRLVCYLSFLVTMHS